MPVEARPDEAQGLLDRTRVRLPRQRCYQRFEPVLEGPSQSPILEPAGLLQLVTESRGNVRDDRDAAPTAGEIERDGARVVAGQLQEAAAGRERGGAGPVEVASRVLDADDRRNGCQLLDGADLKVDAGP